MKWLFRVLSGCIMAAAVFWFSLDRDMQTLLRNLPMDRDVLFWPVATRDAAFRAMDRLTFIAKSHTIAAGPDVHDLPLGLPLDLGPGLETYVQDQRMAGLVILQNGKVRFERYGLGFSAQGKWTSFSVAKSFTSTLLGAAVQDGYIKSLEDKVSTYLPDMKGSAYDDVSVRQLLTMTSGVKWNEDYADPKSDVAQFDLQQPEPGVDVTVSYMRKLPREAPAGSKWVYKTGETNLIGVLVAAATGKSLSDYLSEKIWKPFGMQQDATWILGQGGSEISGCCFQAATRDYARFGQFILDGGKIGHVAVLPADWIASATTKQADIGEPGHGYGYQWWTFDDGTFAARGLFGQGIFIDPKRKLIIASNADWPSTNDGKEDQTRLAFYTDVQKAIDAGK